MLSIGIEVTASKEEYFIFAKASHSIIYHKLFVSRKVKKQQLFLVKDISVKTLE